MFDNLGKYRQVISTAPYLAWTYMLYWPVQGNLVAENIISSRYLFPQLGMNNDLMRIVSVVHTQGTLSCEAGSCRTLFSSRLRGIPSKFGTRV